MMTKKKTEPKPINGEVIDQEFEPNPQFLPNPDYTGNIQVLIDKAYDQRNGNPLVVFQVVMPDGTPSPVYQFDVTGAESIARAMLNFAGEHRQRYPADWFGDPEVIQSPIEGTDLRGQAESAHDA